MFYKTGYSVAKIEMIGFHDTEMQKHCRPLITDIRNSSFDVRAFTRIDKCNTRGN